MVARVLTPTLLCAGLAVTYAQETETEQSQAGETVAAESPETPDTVSVNDVVEDHEIDSRLQEIMDSTGWFKNPGVEVENGVVFVTGETSDEKYRKWAGELAGKTEDVVAVVNRVTVTEPPMLDLDPAWTAGRELIRSTVRGLPMIVLSLLMIVFTWVFTRILQKIADVTVLPRIETNLLREVARKAIAIPVLVLGLFLVLRVTGLTQLAMTVMGGTGLFGLVIGIAFRDIAENFLSSILLSVQNPFRYGDLIEVQGHLGFVQRVNTRGTILMTFDGNHIQIPNSEVYKGVITNYTSNPNRRFSFTIGIGYDVSASAAQDVAMQVLADHPAVLQDPEPQVLVEQLASSTINLVVYAWVDAEEHSWVKVKSSVMRLTLKAFEEAGFSMPDDQREIVFPTGVPVQMLDADTTTAEDSGKAKLPEARREDVSNKAEGDFRSEADEINRQARESRSPDDGEPDLLNSANDPELTKQTVSV